jgi:hypothetical protein
MISYEKLVGASCIVTLISGAILPHQVSSIQLKPLRPSPLGLAIAVEIVLGAQDLPIDSTAVTGLRAKRFFV